MIEMKLSKEKLNYLILTTVILTSCASGPNPKHSEWMSSIKNEVTSCSFEKAISDLQEIDEDEMDYELLQHGNKTTLLGVKKSKAVLFVKTAKEILDECSTLPDATLEEIDKKRSCFRNLTNRENKKISKIIQLTHSQTVVDEKEEASWWNQPFLTYLDNTISTCVEKEVQALNNKETLEESKEQEKADLAEGERQKMEASPEYQKCLAMHQSKEGNSLLKLWTRSLEKQKASAAAAGVITSERAKVLDLAVEKINGFNSMIKHAEKKIKSLSNTHVSEKYCTGVIENFGKSPADDLADYE